MKKQAGQFWEWVDRAGKIGAALITVGVVAGIIAAAPAWVRAYAPWLSWLGISARLPVVPTLAVFGLAVWFCYKLGRRPRQTSGIGPPGPPAPQGLEARELSALRILAHLPRPRSTELIAAGLGMPVAYARAALGALRGYGLVLYNQGHRWSLSQARADYVAKHEIIPPHR